MKKTTKSAGGTSFTGVTIECTPNELKAVAKKLDCQYCEENDGLDKTNFDFIFETNDEQVFTVYDWKFYRPLDLDEKVKFHIGAFDSSSAYKGKYELLKEISSVKNSKPDCRNEIFNLIMTKVDYEHEKITTENKDRTVEDDAKSIYACKRLLEIAKDII